MSTLGELEKAGTFGVPNWILWDAATELCKPHKSVNVLRKSGRRRFLIMYDLLVMNAFNTSCEKNFPSRPSEPQNAPQHYKVFLLVA